MKKLTVTIGISAYNEEGNIAKILKSVISQKEKTIQISEILVYSDGSTDRTVPTAKSFKDKRIRVVNDKIRRGKAFRLNHIFSVMKGDVLVLFDADTVPVNSEMLEYICRPFHRRSFIGLAGGRRYSIPTTSLTGTSLANLFHAYDVVRKELRNGINIYCFLAGITALSRDFAKALTLPLDSPCDDNFIYLEAKKRGFSLAYVPEAIVWFSPPQSASDQISQGSRYLASSSILSRYFNSTYVKGEFYVPFYLRLKVFLYQVRHNPIAFLWLKCLAAVCHIQNFKTQRHVNGLYRNVYSTKRLT
ncbi:MAG: hypothetical protein UV73_C0003G0052 [Candidatus Gottesmanbacteria bacterium GW2011_GWA2_43_14]|uniref:Glycosyltransferase 2-like domain-containing protein n=1 Tax=Candidatus Gottesmanbacteria bacterium GW2011_GWA2_43_14 TaxID=1618443 RepID=A0A0G1DJV3_9BACT|nr:MAG: hypothetical protein UV73_C0003G0052 [Candidatus Gottesmanbacteria bacterium GW2011_GWA2_43_14]